MPCYYPLKLYRSRQGRNKDTGKWSLTNRKGGYEDLPVTVPCGRCIGCRLERSRQWAIRCVHEAQLHENNCFITLTYRDDQLTWGGIAPTLFPRDLELFFKRLRKKYGTGIRYFACGEYGDESYRPHYHACVFGFDFEDKEFCASKNGIDLYHSDSLDAIWTHGYCTIGSVTFESAAYVARYIVGKKLGQDADIYFERGIEPEFVRMSRRPGLASGWLDKYLSDVFPADRCVIRGGILCKPPRFYCLRYERLKPISYARLKFKRSEAARKMGDENSLYRLSVKEKIKKIKVAFTRDVY